jgi:hypothetical protein
MDKFKILDTALIGSGSILFIQWTSTMPIEQVYQLFVQSLVATAAIGKILWDVANKNKK